MVSPTRKRHPVHSQKLLHRAVSIPPTISTKRHKKKDFFRPYLNRNESIATWSMNDNLRHLNNILVTDHAENINSDNASFIKRKVNSFSQVRCIIP